MSMSMTIQPDERLFINLADTLLCEQDWSKVICMLNIYMVKYEGLDLNTMYGGKPMYFNIFENLNGFKHMGLLQNLIPLATVGFDFKLSDESGRTVLHCLADTCEYEFVTIMLQKNLYEESDTHSLITPLHLLLRNRDLACYWGREEEPNRYIRTMFALIKIGDFLFKEDYNGMVPFVSNGVNGLEFVPLITCIVTIGLYLRGGAEKFIRVISRFDSIPCDTDSHRNAAVNYTERMEEVIKILNKDFANLTIPEKARDIRFLKSFCVDGDYGNRDTHLEILSRVDTSCDDTLIGSVIRRKYFHYEQENDFYFLNGPCSVQCDNYENVLYDVTGLTGNINWNENLRPSFKNGDNIFNTEIRPMQESFVYVLLLCGRLEMMFEFLKMRQFDILPMCLMVIIFLKSITKKFVFPKRSVDIILKAEQQYEEMCRRIITSIYAKDQYSHSDKCDFMTFSLLAYGNNSIYELAIKAECRAIVDFELFEAVREKHWLGALERSHMPERVFKIMFPYVVPVFSYVPHFVDKLGWRATGWIGFHSPLIKYVYHFTAHIIFLSMFTYVLMTTFNQSLSLIDILCVIYMLGYMVDEIVEFISYRSQSIRGYLKDEWNIVDIGGILFFFVGFGIRIACNIAGNKGSPQHDSMLYAARVISVTSLLLLYLRTLYYLQVLTYIGPKISMIARMAKNDLLPLLSLFFITLLSFGVAAQVLLYPNDLQNEQDFSSFLTTILKLLVKSFYAMITVDFMLGDFDKGVGNLNISYPDDRGIGLVKNGLLIMYVIIANILLLNLLIAVFSNTISEVETQSRHYWISRRHYITQQISRRGLPPPLNMLCYVCNLCRFCMSFTVLCNANSRIESHVDMKIVDSLIDIEQSIIDIEVELSENGSRRPCPDREKWIKSLRTCKQLSFLRCQATVLNDIRAEL